MPSPDEVVLRPGDFHFTQEPIRIHTLLGSCVSITMWHPRLRLGGMCHFMIASRGHDRGVDGRVGGASPHLDGRYADEAMTMFLDEICRFGTRPRDYEVKIFGAGNQFPSTPVGAGFNVCRDNMAAGLRLTQEAGFFVTARHLGGIGFRRLTFDLRTGAVDVLHVEKLDAGRER